MTVVRWNFGAAARFACRRAVRLQSALADAADLSADVGDPDDQRPDRPGHRLWTRRQPADDLATLNGAPCRPAVRRQRDQYRRQPLRDGARR